jgi:hypothetical protein
MPLVPQRVSFPVTAGQEQGVAPELVDPPVLIKAHNCTYTRQGELTKRKGWVANDDELFVGVAYVPQPERLAKRGDEVLWVGEQRTTNYESRIPIGIISRLPAESGENATPTTMRARGYVSRFNARKLIEISNTNPGVRIEAYDTAFAGDSLSGVGEEGVVCVVWKYEDVCRIDYAVVDVGTKSIIAQGIVANDSSQTGVYVYSQIRVVASKHSDGKWYFHIFYLKNPGTHAWDLYYVTVAAATPWTLGTETFNTQDLNGFDVCVTDPYGTLEQRIYIVRTFSGQTSASLDLITPGAAGVLTHISYTNYTPAAGYYFNDNAIHMTCDPHGNEVGLIACVVDQGCVGNAYTIALSYRVAVYPSHIVTPWADVVLCSYPSTTSDHPGGVQIGWAGTRVVSGVTRYDNWYCTWEAKPTNPSQTVGLHWINLDAQVTQTFLLVTGWMGKAHEIRPYGRHFNYRGQDYMPVVRGCATDAVVIEFYGLHPGTGVQGGDPGPDRPTPYGRCLAGEIAFAGPTPSDYILQNGRNSTAESWYDRGRFMSSFAVVSNDGTEHKIAVIDLDARDPERFDWTEFGGGTFFSGSIPWCYDGFEGHELGFVHRPQSTLTTTGEIFVEQLAVSSPYTSFNNGDYYFALCWEAVDSLGRVARSAPSFSGLFHVSSGYYAQIAYQGIGKNSRWGRGIRPVLYVSNDGGLNYVRSSQVLTIYDSTDEIYVGLYWVNLFNVGAPTLYTSQGIMENSPPPPARFVCSWQNRLWLANDRLISYSRELVDGEEPSFNEALSFQIPYDCSGLAALDDRMVIFCETAIYWVSGDGPTDTGEGGAFAQPQRIPSDFGCIDARSIVRTEKGICFQSKRGIELLDRGLTPRLISGGVDKLLREDGYDEVYAASWDQAAQICRFIVRNASLTTYLVLCWHTLFELWTTASLPVVAAPLRTYLPRGMVNALGTNWMAYADGFIHDSAPQCLLAHEWTVDDEAYLNHLDGTMALPHWYQMQIETANVKLDGLLGFSRVWRADVLVKDMGIGATEATGIQVGYAIDYSTTAASTARTWVSAEDIASGATPSSTHWRYQIHIDKQQCSAIRLLVADKQQVDGTGATYSTKFTLGGFGFEWGQEPGTGRGQWRSKK